MCASVRLSASSRGVLSPIAGTAATIARELDADPGQQRHLLALGAAQLHALQQRVQAAQQLHHLAHRQPGHLLLQQRLAEVTAKQEAEGTDLSLGPQPRRVWVQEEGEEVHEKGLWDVRQQLSGCHQLARLALTDQLGDDAVCKERRRRRGGGEEQGLEAPVQPRHGGREQLV